MSEASHSGQEYIHDDLAPVWDEVFRTAPEIIAEITGPTSSGISLETCIRAFYAAEVKLSKPVYPALLVAMFSHHPEGAFAHRVGNPLFAKDINDIWIKCIEEMREAKRMAGKLYNPWADIEPPEWPRGTLRPDYEATIEQLARRDGVNFGALAMTYVVAVSGAANKSMRFWPYGHDNFAVPPNLYVMAVADPGFRKTLLTNTAFRAIHQRDEEVWEAYQQEKAIWAKGNRNEADKPEEPSPLIVDDIGVEKLLTFLAKSPRGTLMLRDEIAALFDFNRYSKSDKAGAERAFYLKGLDGSFARSDRMTRDTDRAKSTAFTVFGGIQPDRMADFKHLGSDGFLPRWVPLVIVKRLTSQRETIVTGNGKLDAAIGLLMAEDGHDVYQTTPEGQELIHQTELAGEQFGEITDYGKCLQSFCFKLHGLHARLAFILHLLDDHHRAAIPAETVERAGRLTMFCLGHALAFYSRIDQSVHAITKSVAGYILSRPKLARDTVERIVASDITSGVRLCRGMPLKRLHEVLDPLVTGGWLSPESPYQDCNKWVVTDGLREALAAEREAEVGRRAATRALIKDIAAGRLPRGTRP